MPTRSRISGLAKWRLILGLAAGVSVLCGAGILAAERSPQYVGAKKCLACHKKQYDVWSQSGHARAYALLSTEAARPVADKLKVTGDPMRSEVCLKCHVTGFGEPKERFGPGHAQEEGVSCESCHGPGSLYRKAMDEDAEKYAADPKGTVAEWTRLGLVRPGEPLCKTCHSYGVFDFTEKFKKIAHPR